MKKHGLCLLLLCATAITLQAQEIKTYNLGPKNFVLNGTIDNSIIDKGTDTMVLYTGRAGDSAHAVVIDHGRFTFSGDLQYPVRAQLIARNKEDVYYASGWFYIDPGVQAVVCHKDSLREIPDISNNTMRESKGPFSAALAGYHGQVAEADRYHDSISAIYGRRLPDSVWITWWNREVYLRDTVYPGALLAYTRQHPASYLALGQLASSVEARYLPLYDTIYNTLSAALKHTNAGKQLEKSLDGARTIAIGRECPGFTLQDTSYTARNIAFRPGAHKYTLVDFWESHCGPCMQQFATYKKKYDDYKQRGLEIIAISTDYTKDITLWKKTIHDKGYPWPQYLDENARVATSLSINSYPRNFLLDENNIIIMKDVYPAQLDKILNP